MKKILKSRIFFLIIGIVLGSTSIVSAYSIIANNVGFTPKDTNWNVDNASAAINDLYDRATTDGYAAFFVGRSKMSTATKTLPLEYNNSKYTSKNGNTLIINKGGKYQLIVTAIHARSGNTTVVRVYQNGTEIVKSWLNWDPSTTDFNIGNKEVILNKNDTINVDYYTDGSDSRCNTTGGTVILIKK